MGDAGQGADGWMGGLMDGWIENTELWTKGNETRISRIFANAFRMVAFLVTI
jgi:hypothetical protein